MPLGLGCGVAYWFAHRPDRNAVSLQVPTIESGLGLLVGALQWCGLAGLPVALMDLRRLTRSDVSAKLYVVMCACLLGYSIFSYGHAFHRPWAHFNFYEGLFPTVDGVVSEQGFLFPREYAGSRPVVFSGPVRWALTLLGCASAALMIVHAVERGLGGFFMDPLCLFAALQAPLLLLPYHVWDRYLIVLFPAALSLVVPRGVSPRCTSWALGLLILLLTGAASVGLMHDWLIHNAVRWELGRGLLAAGVEPTDVEGGFEWDGWFDWEADDPPAPAAGGLVLRPTRTLFPHITGTYAVAFDRMPATTVVASKSFTFWLVPGTYRALAMKSED
jgi:hypothetical protein